MSELAVLDFCPPLATLRLNRPEQRNALSTELLAALEARVGELERRDDIAALILTGEGRSFCAGMDLKQVIIEGDRAGWPGPMLLDALAKLTLRLRALPMTILAKVNGAAIGGGCGLACVADMSISHADAKVGFPEVDLGLCPAVVAPWVVRKIGPGKARRVLLTGGVMTGQEAYAVGLIDFLAESRDTLDQQAQAIAERLASGSLIASRATKRLLNELDGSAESAAVLRGATLSAEVLASEQAQAQLRARRS